MLYAELVALCAIWSVFGWEAHRIVARRSRRRQRGGYVYPPVSSNMKAADVGDLLTRRITGLSSSSNLPGYQWVDAETPPKRDDWSRKVGLTSSGSETEDPGESGRTPRDIAAYDNWRRATDRALATLREHEAARGPIAPGAALLSRNRGDAA